MRKMKFTFMYFYKHSGIRQAHMKVVVTDNISNLISESEREID